MIRTHEKRRGRPRAPAAGRPRGLRDAERGRHGRPLPGREPRADGLAAAQRPEDASTTSSCRSRSSGPGRSSAAWSTPSSTGGRGRAPVEYPHPCLEPILKRTLGVPLFQEQLLRIAMVAAGFTGGEAEELRRAMGFKRSSRADGRRSRRGCAQGMTERGIGGEAQEQIVKSITSFALYGFPESHAASFALIAYASAYLKAHHPAAFLAALLNAWPMGFYHPATLVKDAQRHGTRVLADRRDALGLEVPVGERGRCGSGLRFVQGLKQATGRDDRARAGGGALRRRPTTSRGAAALRDGRARAARLRRARSRRSGGRAAAALWQVAKVARPAGPLFAEIADGRSLAAAGDVADRGDRAPTTARPR